MGPCTASHCCCLHRTLCHVPLSGLSCHCWWVPLCVIGCCMASHCCCQARNLSWAPVPPPHAAARSRVCHGSLYGLPLLLSPSPHSAMCHFQVSSHCWWVPFCHRVLYGLPLLLPPPPHCGSTLWFWPRDCPNE
ncbi:unnamed protein product [Staurois parvus]|uniref:Uncharacterized protein n=2 Tax=Staurois parvus TaxID=386267 RepID=A0ABN9FT25_9NEOB|nr:unnamed protein product [Staurois parvus]